MPFLIWSVTVQTATFFLSDETEEVSGPLTMREDRPVRIRKSYFHEADMYAKMTKAIHGVGPNGDRWDGIDMIAAWFMGWVRMTSQPGYRTRTLKANCCSSEFGLESGPDVRTGAPVANTDWPNGNPNRSDGWIVVIMRGLGWDRPFSQQSALWQYTLVCHCGFNSVIICLTMSSVSFLKSISESHYSLRQTV